MAIKKVVKRKSVCRKKVAVSRKKRTRPVTKRKVSVTRFYIKKGKMFFNGTGFTRLSRNAVSFSNKKAAVRLANKLSNALGCELAIHS